MAKKYKVEKIHGVKMSIRLEKDHERPAFPKPAVSYRSRRDYIRTKEKRNVQAILRDL